MLTDAYFTNMIVYTCILVREKNVVLYLSAQTILCSQFLRGLQGRIQDFKFRGGAFLKKLRRAEGGAKIFGVFRVKIRDFTPKKQITESPSYP